MYSYKKKKKKINIILNLFNKFLLIKFLLFILKSSLFIISNTFKASIFFSLNLEKATPVPLTIL